MIIREDFFKAEFISDTEFKRILNYDSEMLMIWASRIARHYWGKEYLVRSTFEELDVEKLVYGFFKYNPLIRNHPETMQLAISNRMVKHNYYNPKMVEAILKHELCHWHIFTSYGSVKCQDGHPVFESEIRRVNAISQYDVAAGIVKVIVHRPKKK